jgi:methionine-gamma-lyase
MHVAHGRVQSASRAEDRGDADGASVVAQYLESHEAIEVVRYPGLRSHPQHELVNRQMKSAGGITAFELRGGIESGKRFINAMNLIKRAVSLVGRGSGQRV